MATRNISVSEASKRDVVQNSHTLRKVAEEGSNIGLLAFGTYVSSSFSGSLLSGLLATDFKTLKFKADIHAIVITGEHGLLVREAQVSECGKYALRQSAVIALGEHGKLKVTDAGTIADFVKAVSKGEHFAQAHGWKVNHDGATFYGIGIGASQDWRAKKGGYSALLWVAGNGKLRFVDMEGKKNAYNSKVLGAFMADEKQREAGATAVKALASAGGTVKAKATEGKALKRAQDKKAKGKK